MPSQGDTDVDNHTHDLGMFSLTQSLVLHEELVRLSISPDIFTTLFFLKSSYRFLLVLYSICGSQQTPPQPCTFTPHLQRFYFFKKTQM